MTCPTAAHNSSMLQSSPERGLIRVRASVRGRLGLGQVRRRLLTPVARGQRRGFKVGRAARGVTESTRGAPRASGRARGRARQCVGSTSSVPASTGRSYE